MDVNVVRLLMSGGDVQGISPDNIKPVNPTAYCNIIGKLMYVMVGTHPNIAFAVGVLGRFASNPSKSLQNGTIHCSIFEGNQRFLLTLQARPRPPKIRGVC